MQGKSSEFSVGIIPSFDFDAENEIRRWFPEQVRPIFCKTADVKVREAVSMVEALNEPELLIEPTRKLHNLGARAITYACTACSFVGGREGDEALKEIMRREGAAVALTTSSSIIEALNALKVGTVAIAHPYVEAVGLRLQSYVREAGFDVVSSSGLGLHPGEETNVGTADVHDIVHRVDRPEADSLFISCTALPTYEAIAQLERELGKPVITANQATAWALLRAVGVKACGPDQTLTAI